MGGKGYASCGCDIITSCGCDIITPCGCDIITPWGCDIIASWGCDIIASCGCVGMAGCHTLLHKCHHINISQCHHLTPQFTVMWKHPCFTSYLTRQRFCSRISRNTSESTHFSVSLRTCRRRGPSGSSTVW